ncbi:MAG: hypothetical protein U0871_24415 [Gemmataceae bacterium]
MTAFKLTADFPSAPAGISVPVTVPVENWDINVESDAQDVTDTGSGGWQALINGIRKAEITLTGFWNADANGVNLSTVFTPGRVITVKCQLGNYTVTTTSGVVSGTDEASFFQADVIVGNLKVGNNVRGPLEVRRDPQVRRQRDPAEPVVTRRPGRGRGLVRVRSHTGNRP